MGDVIQSRASEWGLPNTPFTSIFLPNFCIVYDDNVTIFDQIVEGKADLMITDAIETVLQQKLRPQLAAIHPDKPFTYSEKGYLMPRDMVFKAFVDQWLHLTLMGGTFQKI